MATHSAEKRPLALQNTVHAEDGEITPTSPSSDDVTTEEADKKLEAMGYTPVLKREFSAWSSFSFAMSIGGIYGSLMSTWIYGLQAGGAGAIMWSWIIGGAGAWALAMSLAELSSAYPSAGAMYTVIKFLAPEDQVPILCWMSGYITLVGVIAGSASTEYASSQMLLAAISIASDFSYVPTTVHVVGVMALFVIFHASINSLPTLWLTRLTSGYVVFHMSVLVGACVCLLVQAKDKHTLAYAFTDFQPAASGWNPPGFAFLFGCLTPAWIMTNADSTARISEETKTPSLIIPRAIAHATTSTYLTGLLFNLVLVLCMGPSPLPLLSSPSGQPVAHLFQAALGRGPALFFLLAGVAVMNLVAVTGLQSGSRTVFALARDGLLPWSGVWRAVSRRSGTPVVAVWAYAGVEVVVVGGLALVSGAAAGAVFAVCTVALNLACLVPVVCKVVYGRFERGPWHLGRWSLGMNAVAVVWNVLVSVVFLLPTRVPVTGQNMNYAIVVLILVLLFSTGFWYARGRRYYKGPGASAVRLSSATTTV